MLKIPHLRHNTNRLYISVCSSHGKSGFNLTVFVFLINILNNLFDYSAACSYRRRLIGSFNLTGEGVKYAQRSFEYGYFNHPAHMCVCHVQICLNLDDVTVFSCHDVTPFMRPLMLSLSQNQRHPCCNLFLNQITMVSL